MLGGIIFQLSNLHLHKILQRSLMGLGIVIITIYALLAIEFFVRYAKKRPIRHTADLNYGERPHMGMRLKLMIYAMCFTTVCLFIRLVIPSCFVFDKKKLTFIMQRSVYRTAELSDGWSGRIISTQLYFSEYIYILIFPFLTP